MKPILHIVSAALLALGTTAGGQTVLWTAGKHTLPIDSLSLSPDSKQLIVVRQKECAVWEIPTRNKRLVFNQGQPFTAVTWSADSRRYAVGNDDDGITLGLAAEDFPASPVHSGSRARVVALAFAPDGKSLAVADASPDRVVRIFDVDAATYRGRLTGAPARVNILSYSADGSRLAGGCDDGSVVLWDVGGSNPPRTLRCLDQPILAAAWSPDGTSLAVGGKGGAAAVFVAVTGTPRCTLAGRRGPVGLVQFSADGRLLLVADLPGDAAKAGRTVRLHDPQTGSELSSFAHTNPGPVSVSADLQRLAVGGGISFQLIDLSDLRQQATAALSTVAAVPTKPVTPKPVELKPADPKPADPKPAGPGNVDLSRWRLKASQASAKVTPETGGNVSTADGHASLEVPAGAIGKATEVQFTHVEYPINTNEVLGAAVALKPNGTRFTKPATLRLKVGEIPKGKHLSVWSQSSLNPDLRNGRMEPIDNVSYDPATGTASIPVAHFSVVCGLWEEDIYVVFDPPGKYLKKADLLFVLTNRGDSSGFGAFWFPGHAGMYLGSRKADAKENDGNTVIESTGRDLKLGQTEDGVQFTDFNFFKTLKSQHIYMGARRPLFPMTDQDRTAVAGWAISKRGKGFAWTLIGGGTFVMNGIPMVDLDDDPFHKPETSGVLEVYTCVGLVEAAYEGGIKKKIVPEWAQPCLNTLRLYAYTQPVTEFDVTVGDTFNMGVTGVIKPPKSVAGHLNILAGDYFDDAKLTETEMQALEVFNASPEQIQRTAATKAAMQAGRAKWHADNRQFILRPGEEDVGKTLEFVFIVRDNAHQLEARSQLLTLRVGSTHGLQLTKLIGEGPFQKLVIGLRWPAFKEVFKKPGVSRTVRIDRAFKPEGPFEPMWERTYTGTDFGMQGSDASSYDYVDQDIDLNIYPTAAGAGSRVLSPYDPSRPMWLRAVARSADGTETVSPAIGPGDSIVDLAGAFRQGLDGKDVGDALKLTDSSKLEVDFNRYGWANLGGLPGLMPILYLKAGVLTSDRTFRVCGEKVGFVWRDHQGYAHTRDLGGLNAAGETEIALPLQAGAGRLEITGSPANKPVTRSLDILYEPTDSQATAAQAAFDRVFPVAEQALTDSLGTRDNPDVKPFVDLLAARLPVALKAGHGPDALALWKRALTTYKGIFGRELLDGVSSPAAVWVGKAASAGTDPRRQINGADLSAVLYCVALAQWQSGDLNAARDLLLKREQLLARRREAGEDLTAGLFEPSRTRDVSGNSLLADIEAYLGNRDEALRYWKKHEEDLTAELARRGRTPASVAEMFKTQRPHWYPSEPAAAAAPPPGNARPIPGGGLKLPGN